MNIILDYANKKGLTDVKCSLVGSVAKKTSLIGKADIDIFISFPLYYTDEELKKYGLKFGEYCIEQMNGKSEKKYASHPYVTGLINEFEIDFVPCYEIENSNQLKSAVDRTILHTKYVTSHMTNNEADQVLLLKKFMSCINTYGANYKVSGFSGYLCELLILKYHTFKEVINAASSIWYNHFKIDLENYKTSPEFNDPFIVIDPVDKNRNVAAALTMQKYSEFIIASRNYLKNPKKEFFSDRKITTTKKELKETFHKRQSNCIVLSFNIPSLPTDVIYPQINKTMKSLVKTSHLNDFRILRNSYYIQENKAYIILDYEVSKLPNIKIHTGPYIIDNKNGLLFKKKYPNCFIKNNKWIAETPRKYTSVDNMIIELFKKETMNILKLGKNIKEEIIKGYTLNNIAEFIDKCDFNDEIELYSYLYPNYKLIR